MSVAFRPARTDEAAALRDLERAANLVALAHVFPGQPFPDDAVLEKWTRTIADPAVTTWVVDGPEGLVAFVAYDARVLRHLAVHPSHWGHGIARAAVARALADLTDPRLWVLVENHRARALYTRLGWLPTGRTGVEEWPPYPVKLELHLPGHVLAPAVTSTGEPA